MTPFGLVSAEPHRLVAWLPEAPSVNDYWRPRAVKGRSFLYKTKAGHAYSAAVDQLLRGPLARAARAVRPGAQERLTPWFAAVARRHLAVALVWRTARRVDVDNCAKSVLDALKGLAYDDDAAIGTLLLSFAEPTGGAGVWCTVGLPEAAR